VVRIRGQHCGDIELAGYLTNTTDPVTLVLDLLIPHDQTHRETDGFFTDSGVHLV
jgi:hypothetical protein